MAMMRAVCRGLALYGRQYHRFSAPWRYVASVVVILAAAAIQVSYPAFRGGLLGAFAVADWHAWRIFTLTEGICVAFILLSCLIDELRMAVSAWTSGWIVIPVVISLGWLVVNVVRSYLDWHCYLTLSVQDFITLSVLIVLFMVAGQVLLLIISFVTGLLESLS